MAPADDDLIIDLPDEIVAVEGGGTGAAPAAKAPATAAPDADDRISALERERDAERERASRAEAAARAAHDRAAQADQVASRSTVDATREYLGRVTADKEQITGAIASLEAEAANAEQAWVALQEAGDYKQAAIEQRKIAKAEAALVALRQGRDAAEDQVEAARRKLAAQQEELNRKPDPKPEPAPQTPDEWIDKSRNVLGERGADWLRANKQFASDEKLNRKFLRFADDYVEDHGKDALRSQAFLDALNDRFMPKRERETDDVEVPAERERAPEPAPQRRTPSAAPVSRGNNLFSSRNLDASQVRLPPRLAAFVKSAGLNPTEYAKSAVADIKAGKLPKNFLDPDYNHDL